MLTQLVKHCQVAPLLGAGYLQRFPWALCTGGVRWALSTGGCQRWSLASGVPPSATQLLLMIMNQCESDVYSIPHVTLCSINVNQTCTAYGFYYHFVQHLLA